MNAMTRTPAEISAITASLRSIYIQTERDQMFREHLDRLLQRDEEGNLLPQAVRHSGNEETRGVIVTGGPGSGKSTVIRRNLANHPALSAAAGAEQDHYLFLNFPSPATFKSVGFEVLRATGYPEISSRREAWSIWSLCRYRMFDQGIKVLCLDEAHDLFCNDRRLILRGLKSLMQGDDALIVILAGTDELRDLIRTDPQVQRRFSTLALPSVTPALNGPDIASVIAHYCRKAGLEPPREADLVDRLMHASRYRFGRTLETAIKAIEWAMKHGATRLNVQHFAEAWAFDEGCPLERNVFLSPNWGAIDPDQPSGSIVPARKTRKGKAQ
ncbi:TniB family NTP-binding protein [Ruixingdingia sedimenti]|uniref:TniB family NTP-binding protein n=1 Tax=Ruixingdingia sedimenti TaxID=3073604 RepID=A0ABU1FFK7_9RHOB|nr:TniB family NTP-binding protein [Xinfangfangia sp. LG-4]MDR5655333.1 TniB family NTP-binding protein [Xinfangfangia sp. LG-4]